MKQLPSNVTGKDAMAETLTAFQIFLQLSADCKCQNTCSEFISQIPAKRKYEYAAFKNSTKKIYRICDQPGRL